MFISRWFYLSLRYFLSSLSVCFLSSFFIFLLDVRRLDVLGCSSRIGLNSNGASFSSLFLANSVVFWSSAGEGVCSNGSGEGFSTGIIGFGFGFDFRSPYFVIYANHNLVSSLIASLDFATMIIFTNENL